MNVALREVRDRVIADGIAEVEKVYAPDDPRRAGAIEGFELCESLATPKAFARVLEARRRREQRIMARPLGEGEEVEAEYAAYQRHRYATLQIEWVMNCMLVLWGGPPVSARAVRKVADICAKLEQEAGQEDGE